MTPAPISIMYNFTRREHIKQHRKMGRQREKREEKEATSINCTKVPSFCPSQEGPKTSDSTSAKPGKGLSEGNLQAFLQTAEY